MGRIWKVEVVFRGTRTGMRRVKNIPDQGGASVVTQLARPRIAPTSGVPPASRPPQCSYAGSTA
jgi:hypothetical protein